jgi:hypothetical protein
MLWNLHCILKLKLAEASKQRTTYFAEMYDLSFSGAHRYTWIKVLDVVDGTWGDWLFFLNFFKLKISANLMPHT